MSLARALSGAKPAAFPGFIAPCLATLPVGTLPAAWKRLRNDRKLPRLVRFAAVQGRIDAVTISEIRFAGDRSTGIRARARVCCARLKGPSERCLRPGNDFEMTENFPASSVSPLFKAESTP